MNLLTKLVEKFKNIKDETKKRIVATVLAGGIALSGLGMTGCTSCNPDPNNTNPPITNPGGNNGGSQTPGGNNGGSQTPGSNSSGNTSGGNNSGSQNPDYSKYSQILQNVLTDPYYRDLEYIHSLDGNKSTYNKPKYMAIPYGFLEDEGFDIENIKQEKLYSRSDVYTIGNDLFIELRAEIDAGKEFWEEETKYLANYILKYTLTDQEMKELKALHTPIPSLHSKTTYLQAPLFIQELSYLKTPKVVSKTYITQNAINKAEIYCNEEEFVGFNSNRLTFLGTEQINSYTYQITFQTHMTTDNSNLHHQVKTGGTIYVLKFRLLGGDGCIEFDNKSININTKAQAYTLFDENKEWAIENKKNVTLLSSRGCSFKNVKDTSIEELLTK